MRTSEGRSGFGGGVAGRTAAALPAGLVALDPGMHPHDLPRLLLDAGFEDGGDEPAMAAQLAALAEMPMATELQVTPVEDSSALDEYRQVLAAGFGEGPKEADWVASVFAIIGLEPQSMAPLRRHGRRRSCRHRLHPADRLDRRHLLRLHAARRPPTWLWCRDHQRSDAPRGAHRSHVRRPRLLADRAARASGSDSEPSSPPGSSSWTRSSPSMAHPAARFSIASGDSSRTP